jgi:nucleoside phosphorylase
MTSGSLPTKTAVILTALDVETRAVLRHVKARAEESVQGTVFHTGEAEGWKIAVAETGAGNAGAAALAERAINHFRPRVALFVGVAGGVKDVALGDVVVGTKVYLYESGRDTAYEFKPRPDVRNGAHSIEQRGRALRQTDDWLERLDPSLNHGTPNIFVGAIAAGEKVIASKRAATAKFLKNSYSDTLAVEMEGRGFLEGVHINATVEGSVIRGISDLLSGKKNADKSGSQVRAADAASAVAFTILAGLNGRDYCPTLQEASVDYGHFEEAELDRILQRERQEVSIDRTLGRQETPSDLVASDQLLIKYPAGAVVFAPSGYGKTTLCRRVIRQGIEERRQAKRAKLAFDVPLPDLEQSQVSVIDFMQKRLSAHCPGVTTQSLMMMIRGEGATLVCDGFDRTTLSFQKKIAVELGQLLRDYPLVQLFVFSRAAFKPSLSLPSLELLALTDEQVRELENLILSDGNAKWFSIIGLMTPTLRALCDNPLLLRQILGYWKRENDFPKKIEFLFRSWLDNVLETEPSDHASTIRREQALTLLAQATFDAPITLTNALALFDSNSISADVLNELIGCDALRVDGAAVQVCHEALADYLRAAALASKSNDEVLAFLPGLSIPVDSFFPVLLMAQLRTRELQSAFWKRLSAAGLSRYLDALRYRFDLSAELEGSDSSTLSRHFLEDLLDGIETPLGSFFPDLREAVIGNLTNDATATLAATGMVRARPAAIGYKLHALEHGQDRVTVAAVEFPGVLRGANLDMSRYRIDCARPLGMTLLRDTVLDAIKHQQLKGGPRWAAERLIGRVRYVVEQNDLPLGLTDTFDKIGTVLRPLSDQWVGDGAFFGGDRFSIQSLLDDIAILRADGQTALDPWWLRLGWDDAAASQTDETVQRLLNEEYRRAQLVYREIVQASFPIMTDPVSYFAAFPVRWSFTVPTGLQSPQYRGACWRSSPVASWDDAGADVAFGDNATIATAEDWEDIRRALSALGRTDSRIPHYTGSMAFLPRYDGRQWNGHFDGATPVTHQVCAWLKEEVERLFEALPGSDGAF